MQTARAVLLSVMQSLSQPGAHSLKQSWNIWFASEHPFTIPYQYWVHAPGGSSLLTHGYHPLTSWVVAWWPLSLVARVNLAVFLEG